jgi:uncharacterized protein (PEP-CTERM system associated)
MGRMARGQYGDQARGRSRSSFGDLGGKALGVASGGLVALGLVAAGAPARAQAPYFPGAAAAPGAFGLTPGAFTTAPGAYGAPPPAAAVVEPPLAETPVEIPEVPPAWLLVPALSLGESLTDNANLAPAGTRVWDVITTIGPELDLTGQTGRINLAVTYDPQELIFARSSPNHVLQQRLLGTGTAILWPETLFFDASASISQAFIRPTGPVGPTTLTTSNNLTTVYATNASPYLRQHLGAYSDSETRYRFSTSRTSAAGIAPEDIHELRQTFFSGEAFGRLGWQATGDFTRLNREHDATDPLGGTSSKDALGRADLRYPIYYSLSAVGGVGYERISDPTLSTAPKGIIWDTGVQYQPNQLVAATLTYGERFNTTDIEFNGTYNLDPQLRLSAIYTETIQTSQSQIAGATSGIVLVPGPNGTLIAAPGGTPGGIPTGLTTSAFGISSGAFLAKTAELDAVLTKERNTYSGRIYETKTGGNTNATISTTIAGGGTTLAAGTTSASAVTAERITGASVNWDHKLWPDLTASAGTSYYRARFGDGSGRVDNAYTLSLALAYTLSRDTTANITLSRSDLRSNIAVDSLIVDTVTATIRKQF